MTPEQRKLLALMDEGIGALRSNLTEEVQVLTIQRFIISQRNEPRNRTLGDGLVPQMLDSTL